MMGLPAGEPVTRVRLTQTGEDRYGNPVYEDVATLLDERAAFDPGGSLEPVEVGRAQTITTPKLYFWRERPDITRTDTLVVRGKRYTVEGDPADWRDPWGSGVGGLVVELKRATG